MRKNLFLISLLLLPYSLKAWTLNSSSRTGFATSDVSIVFSSNTCINAGFTSSSMETLVNDAINDYWSKVPTSSLNLSTGGVKSVDTSSDNLTAAANKTAANTIIVGCSQDSTLFPSGAILGVGGNGCTSTACYGAVLLNDTAATQLKTLDRSVILTTFAHELGHALGLGHSSQNSALMYYKVSDKVQKSLSQDDIDGISYLYPSEKKIGGLGGACASIDLSSSGPRNFLVSLLFGILLAIIFSALTSFKKSVKK